MVLIFKLRFHENRNQEGNAVGFQVRFFFSLDRRPSMPA
jgi:hypothetical protein